MWEEVWFDLLSMFSNQHPGDTAKIRRCQWGGRFYGSVMVNDFDILLLLGNLFSLQTTEILGFNLTVKNT